jgi:NAD+ kinase
MATAAPRKSPTTVGLVTHPRRNCDEVFTALASWVRARGLRLIGLPGEAAAAISRPDQLPAEDFARTADLVIAAGGDGTILRALALATPAGVPVLGVNLGRLGFLAEVDPPELGRALDAIGARDYRVEERLALECTVHTDHGPTTVRAFNDLVVWRTPGFGQAALSVSVGGELFARYAADGIILATPTGSTAYTLSVGGPIVSPAVDAILITPLAPHGLFNRTLTIAATERLEIDVLAESAPVVVERDGTRERELMPGARIDVRRSDAPGLLVRLGWTSFYGRARRKLQLADPIELGNPREAKDHPRRRT